MRRGFEIEIYTHQGGTEVDDDRLREAAEAGGQRLANDKGASRRRTNHVAMQHPEIPFPNRGNSIEDGDEQYALREDAGRQEIKVGSGARTQSADLRHDLAEEDKPQHRLYRTA
jgi:hypothetical protein